MSNYCTILLFCTTDILSLYVWLLLRRTVRRTGSGVSALGTSTLPGTGTCRTVQVVFSMYSYCLYRYDDCCHNHTVPVLYQYQVQRMKVPVFTYPVTILYEVLACTLVPVLTVLPGRHLQCPVPVPVRLDTYLVLRTRYNTGTGKSTTDAARFKSSQSQDH